MSSFSAPSLSTTSLSQDSLADLELLDYWHRRHAILANTPGSTGRLEYDPDAVRLGFSHHYLLNSILALAALQLFDENRSQTRWYLRAVRSPAGRHHSGETALPEFGRVAAPSPSEVLFLYLDVCRGRASSPTRSTRLPPTEPRPERQCVGQERVVCLHAAESLFASIARLVENPTQTREIWKWANDIDSAFLDMCSDQNTVALVIFAHFAALTSLGRGNWYLRSWPAVLLGQIRGLLKDGLEDTIRWPEQVVFGTTTHA
ncbi:hypothetical protein BKA61DRAFT_659690 [Leptodontidium sp. MPI-SDFR-AT-0119]|nr:hypothetical protein BKA61DRAFT_659690 [Leptodontidium sp. MPI-SDFR-AT-0119]